MSIQVRKRQVSILNFGGFGNFPNSWQHSYNDDQLHLLAWLHDLLCPSLEWLNMLKLMLDQGADVTVQDQWGRSAIHLAINCTDDSCLQVLQKAQVDLEAKDILGRTALWHAAAEDGHLVHMRRLLAMGADINVIDAKDNFCLLQVSISYLGQVSFF